MDFKDKVVIVTGAAQGIGKVISLKFAGYGAKVVVSDINESAGNQVVDEIMKKKTDAIMIVADVSKSEDANRIIEKAMEHFGKIDILVNNAGITRDNLLMRMSEEEWDSVLAVNLKGCFNCIRAVTKPLIKQRSGKIINIASVVGQMGNIGQANYSASKAGVIGLTKTVAKELAARNINVNAIAPGFIATDMTDKLSEQVKEKLLSLIPLNRLGKAEDVANMVLFLASDKAEYITGQVFNVDGGMVM
jgi:3-oxoacyl-[acyl-carrier protein] reductase